jgi:hypothetical protein
MMVVGLTGGSGQWKTTAANLKNRSSCFILQTMPKALMNTNAEVRSKVLYYSEILV